MTCLSLVKRLGLLCVALGASFNLLAASLATPDIVGPATTVAATRMPTDPLSVAVVSDPMNRVGQPIFVEFVFRNTSNVDLQFQSMSIQVDSVAKERFDSGSTECQLQHYGEVVIRQGATLQQGCRFQMKPFAIGWSVADWRDHLFATDIRYVVNADIISVGNFRYYPSTTIRADELSIFVGGVFGALLLAFFAWIQKLIGEPEAREHWGRSLGFTALLGIRGGIMAIIALLIGKTTQGVGSPVALTVVDFAGGLMVGIFSYPLASWMASTLKIQGVKNSAESGATIGSTEIGGRYGESRDQRNEPQRHKGPHALDGGPDARVTAVELKQDAAHRPVAGDS